MDLRSSDRLALSEKSSDRTPAGAGVAAAPDAVASLLDLSRPCRNLLLLRPLFQLELNKGRHTDSEGRGVFDGIDTHYLVLIALDAMMEGTTVELGYTAERVLAQIAETVAAMDSQRTPAQCARAAEIVLDALDNKGNNYRAFSYEHFDSAMRTNRTVSFRLVTWEPDVEDVYRYRPTPEGYLVYLGMLDLEVEDSQELMEKMLGLLVERGRFDAAIDIARRARTLSIEYRQGIRQDIDAAIRAPGSVRWTRDLGPRLTKARDHVRRRAEEDGRMEDSVRRALADASSPEARSNLVRLQQLIQSANTLRSRLVGDISDAPDAFMTAQAAVFRARRASHLPDLESTLLPILMQADVGVLAAGADDILGALYPPAPPRLYDLNTVFSLLLERRTETTVQSQDIDGTVEPLASYADQFSKQLIAETEAWLRQRLASLASTSSAEILESARAEGMDLAARRCLALMLMRAFALSESPLSGVGVELDGQFVNDIARGSNLRFHSIATD